MSQQAARSKSMVERLKGRRLWVPRMTYAGARMFAAVMRSIGIDAEVTPPSDERTLELAGLYLSGEECFPKKVTLGDFLRVMNEPGFDPDRTAFFMPTAEGPCRFGQYAPYLKEVLRQMGYEDIPVISPSSKNSYDGLGEQGMDTIRRLWWGLVASDVLRKMLLKTRPYETEPGRTDEVFQQSLSMVDDIMSARDVKPSRRFEQLTETLKKCRDMYRAVPARYRRDRPLIGVVGEIFCRMNTFSNRDAVRRIEAHGGEAWISDVSEWVWYTNWSQKYLLKRNGRTLSLEMLGAVIKNAMQRRDEEKLLAPFEEDLVGYEEPHDLYHEVLLPGWPYLPADGALGEMALSIGKSIYLYEHGADGIIDISPFSCMNGIISEAVYHSVSRDHEGMPIRIFYFDDSSSNMDRDLDIFMELAENYRKRKTKKRRYPAFFED